MKDRKMMVIGLSLVFSGAVMAGIGIGIGDEVVVVALPSLGSALLSAGLVATIGADVKSGRRAAAVGGALVAGGTAMAVIGAISTHPDVSAALAPLGAGLVAAGLVTVLWGAGGEPAQPRRAGSESVGAG